MERIDLERAGDYIGAHIRMDWCGRTLLGEVTNCVPSGMYWGPRFVVRHFNGEPWPCHPLASDVGVLERDYE